MRNIAKDLQEEESPSTEPIIYGKQDDTANKMIRQIVRYCLAWGLALFFLFQGIGFNYVHYCCDACAAEGIEHVMSESCDAVHQHQHHQHTADCHHQNKCVFKRLAVSKTTVEHTETHFPPVALLLFQHFSPIVPLTAEQPVAPDQWHSYGDEWQLPDGKTISIRHCLWLL